MEDKTGSRPPEYIRPIIPYGCRRAPWHDYRSKCIYMITINAAPGTPPFSTLSGIPNDHYRPATAIKSPLGEIIHSQISEIKSSFPFANILRRIIMPDHIHFAIHITEPNRCSLGDIILHFKTKCAQLANSSIFEKGYHDRILLKQGQLKKMLNYISDNPRRRMLRLANPDFFSRAPFGEKHEMFGNHALLLDPDIEAVRISRTFSQEELRRLKLNWKRTAENCGVLVSPFISEAERRVRDWAIDNGGRLIIIQSEGFGNRFAPKGKLHELCAEGRLLIIAPRLAPPSSAPLSRADCLAMNALAARIANPQ